MWNLWRIILSEGTNVPLIESKWKRRWLKLNKSCKKFVDVLILFSEAALADVLKNSCYENFANIHRKTNTCAGDNS